MKKILTILLSVAMCFCLIGVNESKVKADETPDYLTFTANVDHCAVFIEKVGDPDAVNLEYRTNSTGWTTYTPKPGNEPNWIDLYNSGDYIKFRAASGGNQNFSKSPTPTDPVTPNCYKFSFIGSIAASGNIMSLLDKTCNTTEIPCEYCFNNLFNNCSQLTSAPILPATTLTAHCYESMFYGCTSLASAPTLPATTLADYCYGNMFMGCTNLTSAPVLSATTLKNNCYYNMFAMCTSLEAPASMSHVETLADNCCFCMYLECSQLKLYDTNVNSGYKTAWTIPNITEATTWNTFMLAGCKYNDITPIIDYDNSIVTYGTTDFTGTPSINTTYYVKGTSLPSSSGSLVEYDATKGFDCEYIKGKMTTTTAHITDADMSDFVTVRDKNRVLDNGIDYTLEYGSIKVVFQPAYLDTLDVGVHVLNINVKSTDYKVTITVKNGETSNTPKGNNIGYTPVNTGTK